jgi:invasion protein IalB
MRNTLIGGALAIVLVAALFVAAQYGRKPAVAGLDTKTLTTAEISKGLSPDFVGEQKIGDWKLFCGQVHELPKPPPLGGHESGNSAGTPPREPPPPPGWHIPRCRVVMAMRNPKHPDEEIRITFRAVGFKRALAIFLRFPPTEVDVGDGVTLQLDNTSWDLPIRTCAKPFCLSIQSIKLADLPTLMKAKKMALKFKPAGSPQPVLIPAPTDGLADAIEAMRRLDK